ncbi:MAG: hypothetical protein C0429_14360 [Sphingopyxis sp.]|nr:hypothetical protein [Sphingopyxis sp.]
MVRPAQKRSVFRDLLTVMSGTAGAQALGLLILPILARAFAPEAFGVFQLYLSFLIFCTVGIALRIELTLVTVDEENLRSQLTSLFTLVVITGLGVSAILSFLNVVGVNIGFPIWLFGLGLVSNGIIQITSYKLIRDQDFNRLAALKFGQVGIYAIVALAIAYSSPSVLGIIVADVTGRLGAATFGIFLNRREIDLKADTGALKGLPRFVRKHWELLVVSLPGAMANSAGAMLTPFMIFHLYGATQAGQFSLVDRAMGVPVAMIVSAGSQVFLGRITVKIRAQDYRTALHILFRIVGISALVAGFGAVIVRLILPYAFPLLFGQGWEMAILLSSILVFGYAAAFVTGIVNQTLIALREFRWQAIWDMGWLGAMGSAWFLVATFNLSIYTAVSLHALVVTLLGFIFVFLCVAKLRGAVATKEMSDI